MTTVLLQLFNVIAPVMVCAGIGYAWERSGRPFDTELVSTLVTNIGVPCLVFAAIAGLRVEPAALGAVGLAAALTAMAAAVLGIPVLRLAGLSLRSFVPPLMFPNCGNMGLPLVLLAFGERALPLGVTFFAVSATALITVGTVIYLGTTSLRQLVQVPIVPAAALAFVFALGGVEAPAWILNTTRLIGNMVFPLMLILLGISLGRLRIGSAARASLLVAVLRLGLGFVAGVGVAALLGLEGTVRGVVILESSMPAAVFNYIFALRGRRSPDEVAGVVVLSSLISFATLPFLVHYVMP